MERGEVFAGALKGIRANAYRGSLHRTLSEAMLGRGVICVEGISDADALMSASDVMERFGYPGAYTPLDLSGVTIVHCGGGGSIPSYGKFFQSLGKRVYAFYDRQNDKNKTEEISSIFDESWQLEQTGIEFLLVEEVAVKVLREFLKHALVRDDYPFHQADPVKFEYTDQLGDDDVRKLAKRVLKERKGFGYVGQLVDLCKPDELPTIIVEALKTISEALPNDLARKDGDKDDDGTVEDT